MNAKDRFIVVEDDDMSLPDKLFYVVDLEEKKVVFKGLSDIGASDFITNGILGGRYPSESDPDYLKKRLAQAAGS